MNFQERDPLFAWKSGKICLKFEGIPLNCTEMNQVKQISSQGGLKNSRCLCLTVFPRAAYAFATYIFAGYQSENEFSRFNLTLFPN